MATKDTPNGLLARVANFVRSPAADAPPVNAPDEGETGKQAIKRMIERKAHNDAVRRREFSQLRKLRAASPAALSEMAARASFFQDSSSYPVSEGRESTLKKIDEIEAQMSKQWWKGQQGKTPEATPPGVPVMRPQVPSPRMIESQLETCNTFAPTMPTNLGESALTIPGQTPGDKKLVQPIVKVRPAMPPQGADQLGISGFSSSKMVSIDMGQVLSDPVLEDAAIRFANSDDAGAEFVLTLALKANAASPASKNTWTLALLDMYRSTGQQASYDRLALEYAQRPDRLVRSQNSAQRPADATQAIVPPAHSASSPTGFSVWRAPVVLDKAAVDQLQGSVATGHSHTRLDWQALKLVTPDAAAALATLMGYWCEQPLTLQLDSLEVLDDLLRVNTPVGDRQVARFWWQLRMNVLRVLGSQDEFELVSMDYCVTYEVSPPAWQSPRCHRAFGQLADTPAKRLAQESDHGNTSGSPVTAAMPFVDANASQVELVGDVLGTVAEGLLPLEAALQGSADLLVNCERLVRVDFSAAGSILNWVASSQAAGTKIEFCHLPHLVAAFFNLIGINEHARVTARANQDT